MVTPPTPPYNFSSLIQVVDALLGPKGCPWDKMQTHTTLARYIVEEAYECVEAIENDDDTHMSEELGDLLFQVVLHSQLSQNNNNFNINTVITKIVNKMITRHPHVFSDLKVADADEVLKNWELQKKKEKPNVLKKTFDLPPQLPALMYSQKIGEKTQRLEFDWSRPEQVLEKVDEELLELKQAIKNNHNKNIQEELGDLLFSVTQLSRHLNLDAEQSLRNANKKFITRFDAMMELCSEQSLSWKELTDNQKESLWTEVKNKEPIL